MRPEEITPCPAPAAQPNAVPPPPPQAGELTDRDLEQVSGGKMPGGGGGGRHH
jgi:hypothetical protein